MEIKWKLIIKCGVLSMLMLRITLSIIFWIVLSVFSCVFFYDYNVTLRTLIIFPGILPFIPVMLPKPKYGWRWVYICVAIVIQLTFCFFDLLWGNLDLLSFMVIGLLLLYYSIIIKNNKTLVVIGVVSCAYFFYLLGCQLYSYTEFFMSDICFNYEQYCGSSCYKDYSEVSCRTKKWKSDVFHGSPGSHYMFDIVDGNVYVIFRDNSDNAEYLLINGEIKDNNIHY